MRLGQRRLYLLAGLPLLGVSMFWTGMVVTDHLEQDNTFCTSCHLHEEKFSQFHPVQGQRITLAAAHNIAGDLNVKCIDCHIGATFTDKVVIKAVAARDTVAYLVGAFQEPNHLRYPLGNRTCLKCHTSGGQSATDDKAFHNATYHFNMPLLCDQCHTVHPQADVSSRFLRQQIVQPLCHECHQRLEQ
jgi:hypothetical protein